MNQMETKQTSNLAGYNLIQSIIFYLQNNQDSANHQESHTETCHTDSGYGYNDCHHGK